MKTRTVVTHEHHDGPHGTLNRHAQVGSIMEVLGRLTGSEMFRTLLLESYVDGVPRQMRRLVIEYEFMPDRCGSDKDDYLWVKHLEIH